MERRQTAVIIRYVREDAHDRDTTYYGPFLPHAGSAVDRTIYALDESSAASGRWHYYEAFVEPVFIGAGESDCRVCRID